MIATSALLRSARASLADDLWESRRHGTLDDWPWAECGPYWQGKFRELAETAIDSLS